MTAAWLTGRDDDPRYVKNGPPFRVARTSSMIHIITGQYFTYKYIEYDFFALLSLYLTLYFCFPGC